MNKTAPANPRLFAVVCLTLALVTLGLYWPATHHEFVNLDDQAYITQNPHVQTGLTWPNFVWAFTNTEAANWHPVTWLSHMADCEMFGLNPGAHHLVNVLFHIANTLLLFLFLTQTTGAFWRSAFVAALFAWHPLRVESVAWAAERKDVLSAFFWLLTLIAYAKFADLTKIQNPKSKVFYALALFFFTLGLLSKPMVVTLPFVLLLLDVWPLNRFSLPSAKRLLLEKIPFFALSLAASLVTFIAQKSGGAIWADNISIFTRLANSLVAYASYLEKLFWPAKLAVIYPYQSHWPTMTVVGATILIFGLSALAIRRIRHQPYLFTGWFYFLGTLVPVIGVVHFGAQFIADRYTYLPCIGLFIAIVWSAADLCKTTALKIILATGGIAALTACGFATENQLNYWRDSVTLFQHTLDVTTNNYTACNFLGRALDDQGQPDAAIKLYTESVSIAPHYPQAQYNLGMSLLRKGDAHEASRHLAAAVQLVPDNPELRFYLARALAKDGWKDWAIWQLKHALRLEPDFVQGLNEMAWLLSTSPEAKLRDGKKAVNFARRACELTQGRQPLFLLTLAAAYAETGKFHDAIIIAHAARQQALASGHKEIVATADELLKCFEAGKPFREKT